MKTKFKGGRHAYYGKQSGSGSRKMSKLYKGIVVNTKELEEALSRISKEYGIHPSGKMV